MDNLERCWIAKKSGTGLEYQNQISGKPTSDVVFNIRSMIWPGAHIFYKDGNQFRIYVGDGLKYEPTSYYPSFNHTIPQDIDDPELMCEYKSPDKKPEEDLQANPDQDSAHADDD